MYPKDVIKGSSSGTLHLLIPHLDFGDVAGLDPYTHLIRNLHCPIFPLKATWIHEGDLEPGHTFKIPGWQFNSEGFCDVLGSIPRTKKKVLKYHCEMVIIKIGFNKVRSNVDPCGQKTLTCCVQAIGCGPLSFCGRTLKQAAYSVLVPPFTKGGCHLGTCTTILVKIWLWTQILPFLQGTSSVLPLKP